jgi:ABC-2 type transport system permease protein
MSTVRLEWLRLWRTYRLLILVVAFAFFGLIGPLTAAYLPEIIGFASQSDDLGLAVDLPEPVPADGIIQYVGNVSQIGIVVVAAIASLALAIDARPGSAAFYRTRQPSPASWIVPRWAATSLAASAAWTVGLLAAIYETLLLIGPLPVGAMVVGWGAWVVYLGFAVAVVALVAGFVRSSVGVTAVSVGLLLGMALLGLVPQIGEWLPSHLVVAPSALAAESAEASDYLRAVGVSVAAAAAALVGATALAKRREL